MTAQALYRRWRPQNFDDVVGQEHVTTTLKNALATDRLAHAYLFTGVRGTGKTSVARILAKALNCTGPGPRPCNACAMCRAISDGRSLDLIEIDAASNTGVDDVRDLREKIGFSPTEGRYKVYIVDEVHMLSTAAFNALLKTLEEPPSHAVFILATTEPHKVPETITSRCQRFDFKRVAGDVLVHKLERIVAAEGVTADPAALRQIARRATGSLRDAESLLDQLMGAGDHITADDVRDLVGSPGAEAVRDLVGAMLAADGGACLRVLHEAQSRGADPRQFQTECLDYLRTLLLVQNGAVAELDLADDERRQAEAHAAAFPPDLLLVALHRFNEARPSADRSLPSLPLELAAVETALDMGDLKDGGPPTAKSADLSAARRSLQSLPATPDELATNPAATRPQSAAPDPSPAAADMAIAAPDPSPAAADMAIAAPDPSPAAADTAIAAPDPSPATADAAITAPEPVAAAYAPAADGALQRLAPAEALEQVCSAWTAILAAVAARDRTAFALLKDCRPVAADGAEVHLGFFSEFHRQRASDKARTTIIAALGEVLGAPQKLVCTVVSPTPSEDSSRPRSKSDQAAADPLVRHALDAFGAKIAGVQGGGMGMGE